MDDLFREAVRAIGRGDALRLKDLLSGNPGLVHARGEPETGYFSRATLLHHTAGNPSRCPIPPNVVEIMELLLNAGVPVDAETDFGDWSWTALGLVASGRQPCESGLWGQMIDCLLQAGADINVRNGIVMYGALFHTQECQGQRTVAE